MATLCRWDGALVGSIKRFQVVLGCLLVVDCNQHSGSIDSYWLAATRDALVNHTLEKLTKNFDVYRCSGVQAYMHSKIAAQYMVEGSICSI